MPRPVEAMLPSRAPLRVALIVALVALGTAPPAGAQGAGGQAKPPVSIEVQLFEFGILPSGVELVPGQQVSLFIHNVGDAPHNLYVGEAGAVAKFEPQIPPGALAQLNFTVPATGPVVYYCAIPGHRELGMSGNITLKGQAAAAAKGSAGAEEISKVGVNLYAYWIGVISFIMLFVVLAATFFLLRYGESAHWTDWKDRPARDKGKEGEAKAMPLGTWVVLGVMVVLFLVAAVQVARVV
jgi:plastocyanin